MDCSLWKSFDRKNDFKARCSDLKQKTMRLDFCPIKRLQCANCMDRNDFSRCNKKSCEFFALKFKGEE